MNKVEERFMNSNEAIIADNNWISDGIIVINKKLINNKFLKSYKLGDKKFTFKNFRRAIKKKKGECINYINKVGAKSFLTQDGIIAVDIDGINYIDHAILETVVSSYWVANYIAYDYEYEQRKGKVIELRDEDDDIIGYITGCIYNRKVCDDK